MRHAQRGLSTATNIAIILALVLIAGLIITRSRDTSPDQVNSASPSQATAPSEVPVAMVTDERIKRAAVDEPGAWLSYGRTFEEQRFSPLTDINRQTVSELGLAWFKDLETTRALEATPLVVDDIMYFTSAWSIAYALDARPATIRLPVHPGQRQVKSTSATAVPSSACAGMSRPMMPRPVNRRGVSIQFPAIPRYPSSIRRWNSPQKPGKAANGGRSAGVARSGIPLSTIRTFTQSTWALVTARPGPEPSVPRAGATTCSWQPSSRWMLIPAQ